VFAKPLHPYTAGLLRSVPRLDRPRGRKLETIDGLPPNLLDPPPGCRFAPRCAARIDRCEREVPPLAQVEPHRHSACLRAGEMARVGPAGLGLQSANPQPPATKSLDKTKPLLAIRDLKTYFEVGAGIQVFKRARSEVRAVDGLSFDIFRGETVGLVGESGCGKTTVGKGILQLVPPTGGQVLYDNRELTQLKGEELRTLRRHFQIIFQDPYASLNPRMLVGEILEEGMRAQGIGSSREQRQVRMEELLQQVGLPSDARQRYPHEFSGGQRQRISIARALAVEPELIVCDEPTSALDVSVQAQVLNLLKGLQDDLGLSYLFITHNLSVVEYLAHEVAVMYLGRIVERGRVDEVLENPKHPYTEALLSAVPVIEAKDRRTIIRLQGDMPSPSDPPAGCHFHPRCPQAMDICRRQYPATTEFSSTHEARCHLFTTGKN
jgi:peptide/nickel transport system ATP-binding protein